MLPTRSMMQPGSFAGPTIPTFIQIVSGIQKLIGELHRQQNDLISLLLFLQTKERMLKKWMLRNQAVRVQT
jgi:hypothetical protein